MKWLPFLEQAKITHLYRMRKKKAWFSIKWAVKGRLLYYSFNFLNRDGTLFYNVSRLDFAQNILLSQFILQGYGEC